MLDRIKSLIAETGLSQTAFLLNLGLPSSAITEWSKGKAKPSLTALVKIADYLDCSVDYLLGRTTHSNQNINAGDISNSNVISGNNNTLSEKSELSIQEQDFLRIYRSLDGKTQMQLMQVVYEFEDEK